MKMIFKENIFCKWYEIYGNFHNIHGPAFISKNRSMPSYYIYGKCYNNFISYIKAVIEYKKGDK